MIVPMARFVPSMTLPIPLPPQHTTWSLALYVAGLSATESLSAGYTPLTSNPSNALSVMLKTGGNGSWLTTVALWHMQYLLRQISRCRHDRASGLCASPFALRVAQCLAAVVHRASCIVLVPPCTIVTHAERSCPFNSFIVTHSHHASPHAFDHPSRPRRHGSDTRTHLGAGDPH